MSTPSPGLRMGRPFGIPVYVSPTWLIVAAFITITYEPQVAARLPEFSQFVHYSIALLFAVLLYVSVLLHELAHCVVAKAYGLPVKRITLYLLGGVSEIEQEPDTPGKEFLVSFAGPVVSLGLAGIFFGLEQLVDSDTIPGVLLFILWTSNLIVGVFNLLPGLPLDGGRMLRAGVWKVTHSPNKGTVAAAWIGRGLAVVLVLSQLVLPLMAGQEPDFTTVLWSMILAAFIWMGASQSLRVAKVRSKLPQVRARALARRAFPVAADVPLAEALRRARESGAGALVIVDHEGRPTGIVNEAAVNATPEPRRPWINVGSLARTLEPALVLGADLEGESLIDAMRDNPSGEYLLVERGGEIYGVLATADVNRVFTGV
ncbi:site-2 protease family protein [Herbidospora mongoliensis]|uniref:site-2 protease family protein n=1 Tax=Herbidospora mongoliensis TaxID=688067 RepID=UPI00082DDFD7|nr:site-2 protease family protein [Herbidospora mongoliensis]